MKGSHETLVGMVGAQSRTPDADEFNPDFVRRVDLFIRLLKEAPFGAELLYEFGRVYTTNAQRYLGIKPWYAPRALLAGQTFRGWRTLLLCGYKRKVDGKGESVDAARRRCTIEFFCLEYDNAAADLHVIAKHVSFLVHADAKNGNKSLVHARDVDRLRMRSLWFLGERMMVAAPVALRRGTSSFQNGDEGMLMEYLGRSLWTKGVDNINRCAPTF